MTTEAGKRLDSAWPGTHLDRVAWHEAIAAIEAEAREQERARIRAAVEALEGMDEYDYAAVLAIIDRSEP